MSFLYALSNFQYRRYCGKLSEHCDKKRRDVDAKNKQYKVDLFSLKFPLRAYGAGKFDVSFVIGEYCFYRVETAIVCPPLGNFRV